MAVINVVMNCGDLLVINVIIYGVIFLVLGTIAFSFLLLPLCQYVLRPIGNPNCKLVENTIFMHVE